ncbi:uroporphyrinogen-III synthase [Natronosalvus rutilus]|uniref:Uroporphyrinogen-III synthase n=1 Tax=Natronosalvus rutilus TaxID=2953753 RepID=A0A9E7NBC4_9EURY|nr:uroporphyrinogen-III synthase [Natronosalvus rutilus]UTF53780.1 uroporphyrinogen-III synthase [Natronosalvus rutilus]
MRDLTVAVFRPDDDRLEDAVELLESLGATPVPDPMLAVEPTGTSPREDADYAILTSKTGAELVAGAYPDADASVDVGGRTGRWNPGEATLCAVGPKTADALREQGYDPEIVPAEYTSSGLVAALEDRVDGARVEVARSDHGSSVLLEGLEAAGAYVHETVLYRLVRPHESGDSAELAAAGDLDVACFTSSLTVTNWLEAAAERGVRDAALEGLSNATVGVIGEPTRETATAAGIDVDLVASEATFEALATETVELAAPTYYE